MAKKEEWIGPVAEEMERKGTKGAFTAQAKRAGMEVQQFARHVLANPEDFSETTEDRAKFAKAMGTVAKGQRHSPQTTVTIGDGGPIYMDTGKPTERPPSKLPANDPRVWPPGGIEYVGEEKRNLCAKGCER